MNVGGLPEPQPVPAEIEHVAQDGDPEERAVNLALRDELNRHIARLKPEQRLVLSLRMVDGLKYQEIAELLGSTPKAISVRLAELRRARAH